MKFTKTGSGFLPTLKQELAEKAAQRLESPMLADRDCQRAIIISEKLKPILCCTECGKEDIYPSYCGEPMELMETEFNCTFRDRCDKRTPIPHHCGQSMAVIITGKRYEN